MVSAFVGILALPVVADNVVAAVGDGGATVAQADVAEVKRICLESSKHRDSEPANSSCRI